MKRSKINIIIVDNSREFCNILNEYLLNQRDIIVTGIANDGVEALNLIQEKKPDLVVLDIIMPHLDGWDVLKRVNTMDINIRPHIIVLSALSQDKTIQRAIALGADRYIVKPFELDVLIKEIRQLFNNAIDSDDAKITLASYESTEIKINKNQLIDMIDEISNIIHEIGIPDNMKGCLYLREAVRIVLKDNKRLQVVTKDLYSSIGKKFNTTDSRVEREINHAIETTLNRGPGEIINNEKARITNKEFIAMVADKLRIENKIS